MSSDSEYKDAIVVFAKAAVAGRVKTRLAQDIGNTRAVGLYRAFMQDTAKLVSRYTEKQPNLVAKILAYSGGTASDFDMFTDQGFEVVEQGTGILGARLKRVAEYCSQKGFQRLVFLGADSPTLSGDHLQLGFDLLSKNDVVIGPSFDGGYYLLGVRLSPSARGIYAHEKVFEDISWSSENVLAQTWQRCSQHGFECDMLGFWYDVDTSSDLTMLRFHLLNYLQSQDDTIAFHTAQYLRYLEKGYFNPQ